MTDAIYPQVRIVTERLLNPETVERLLNQIVTVGGIRRIILNGPRLPSSVPYGPAQGVTNPHSMRGSIKVGEKEMELAVHVGTILLELESRDVIPSLKAACDPVFTEFTYRIQEGRYMKTEPSLSDYAKYGPDAEKSIIGMADPSSKTGPVILQGIK
jgi:methyl-coenzyme M reductase subunit D